MSDLQIVPVPSVRLSTMRAESRDDLGNPVSEWVAEGWEPLRCCLRLAAPGESLALVSYAPDGPTDAWREAGPVFMHLDECEGYEAAGELPSDLRTGPRILRTYNADGSLDYADITLVADGEDIEAAVHELLDRPAVARIHVRAHLSQCFLFEVRRPAA
jgi:hypothetical protein